MLHQNRNENDKNTNFMIENNNKKEKKCKKKYMKALSNMFFMNCVASPLTCDVIRSKL